MDAQESPIPNSTPETAPFAEGFDVQNVVRELAEELNYRNVIDYGCGEGRLCESFRPEHYLGIDTDHEKIAQASKKFSEYQFISADKEPRYADIYLAYDVFNELKDSDLHESLKNIRCNWLIVGELLGKQWRSNQIPLAYHRELSDYISIMRSHDLILHKHVRRPFKKYSEAPWYQDRNTDISFLVFKKCLRNPLY